MEVPTISLAAYHEASICDEEDPATLLARSPALADLVSAVRAACEDAGFFVAVDHGVGIELMKRQRRECEAFFARAPQSTVLAMLSGHFAWLDFVPGSGWSLGPVQGRGSLPWRLDSEALTDVWTAYYGAMEQLVHALMRLFALALGLPAGAFATALRGHCSSLRALVYPEVDDAALEAAGGSLERSSEHTDWGCVTVLLADECVGGLEVRCRSGTWIELQPEAGGLVVNLGELLPMWTGGRWVAMPHRVVARRGSAGRRLSVPYFGLVNRETVLAPLCGDAAQTDEPTITAGEFFDRHEEYAQRPAAAAARA